MSITITLTIPQASSIIYAISTCLHLADKSPVSGMAYGIDITMVERLNQALDKIEDAVPQPQPLGS